MHFDGVTFDQEQDGTRLARQFEVVRDWMLNATRWYSLTEIATSLGYPEASVSARLRDLRKPRFGSWLVEKRRRASGGTWEYRVSIGGTL